MKKKQEKRSKNYFDDRVSNVVVEWLALLLRIQEVPGSNLGQETDYPE
jgi:hypothetical protein